MLSLFDACFVLSGPLVYLSGVNPFNNAGSNTVERYTDVVMEQVVTSYDGLKPYFVTAKNKCLLVEVDSVESARGATKTMYKVRQSMKHKMAQPLTSYSRGISTARYVPSRSTISP